MTDVCLNMIVRNEAHVMERCLDSVRPFIDRWVIVDTGSTDGTQDLIRKQLKSVPGTLHERPWKNFAHNRNEALELAIRTAPYVFFIDADETLARPEGYLRPPLDADAYSLVYDCAGCSFTRCTLVASRLPWRWEGVLHEFLDCNQSVTVSPLEGPRIVSWHDGARSRDPRTYLKDAAVLEEALLSDPGNTRHVFYLAQSYRDAGDTARSREVYERRAAMGGWDEEVWYSLYQSAVLAERLQVPPAEVVQAYLRAFQARPSRAEPLVRLARYHRCRSEFSLALIYARQAATMPRPADTLFVEDAVYGWEALDELSIAAYYAGARGEGAAAISRLLKTTLPADVRTRVIDNARFYFG